MALEIGVAYLSVIPSTRGMIREIKRSLNEDGGRVARNAGQDMGREMGKGLKDGFARVNPLEGVEAQVNKAKAAANDAAKEMAEARDKAEKAARKAKIAETEYNEAVGKSGTSTARAMRALDKYREAKRVSGVEATRYLESLAREQSAASNARSEADGLAQSKRELAEANDLAAQSFQSLGERFRSWRRGAGSGPKLQVDVDGTTLDRRMAELTSSISARHKIRVNVDYDRGVLRNMSSGIVRAFSAPTGAAARMGEVASSAFGALAGGIRMVMSQVPGTWVILGTLGAIAAVTFAPLIGSLGQLVNLLALVPAVASGALAAIGGIVAGSLGIFKALGAANKAAAASGGSSAGDAGIKQQKAITKAQDQAARTAEQGAKRVAKAERSLADAQKSSLRAQEDLNDARSQAVRDLEDMNARLAESSLDEEGAILAVRRAYDDMWSTTSDPDASMLDRQESNLRYRQSIQSLEGIRRENERLKSDTAEANKAGVEGSDEVTAAKERVEDATRAVQDAEESLAETVQDSARANADAQDAIQDALAGTGAGAVGAAGGVDEFAEAMANLSPSAREFVESILSLKGAWTELRLATQEALFKDLGPAIVGLADNYFPILKEGLVGFNTEFNTFFHNVIDRLNSPEIQGVWSSFYENARLGLGPLLEGFNKLGEVFAKLSEIGSQSFPRIGEAIDGWAAGILAMIDADPGRIHGWIEDGLTAFGKLKTTAWEVLRIIKNIFAPGTEEGQEMWDKINDTLRGWADTIGDKANQDMLKTWFEDAKVIASDLKTIIEGLAGIFRTMESIRPWFSNDDGDVGGGPLQAGGNAGGGVRKGIDNFAMGEDTAEKARNNEDALPTDNWFLSGDWFKNVGKGFVKRFVYDGDAAKAQREGTQDVFGNEKVKPAGILSPGAQKRLNGDYEGGGAGGNFGEWKSPKSSGGPQFQGENRPLDTSSVSAVTPDASAWDTTKLKFQEMSDSLKLTYDTNVVPLLDGFKLKSGEVGDWFGLKAGEISTAWTNMSTGIQSWYDTSVKPTWDRFTADGTIMGDGWNVVTSLMSGDWGSLSSNVQVFTDNHITPALDRLRGWLDTVHEKFGEVKDGIGKKWDELRGLTARPINFVISDVWNNGLRKGWNKVADLLGIEGMDEVARIPGFFRGGQVSGPGTTTSDSILAKLSTGEHVLTARDVASAGGHGVVYAMRRFLEQGIPFTFDGAGGLVGMPNKLGNTAGDLAGAAPGLLIPGFRRGGAVEPRPAWMDQLERGHEFAQRIAPAPYLLGASSGGVKGGLTDCSGYMSEIADVILGGTGGTRQWATGNFPGPQAGAWEAGLKQGFSVGIVHGGPAGGHTAGTLSAVGPYSSVNVESGGGTGQGATYGGAAQGADSPTFTEQHSLKIGADGAFESAGGPSPEQQRSLIWKKFQEILGGSLDGIGDSIPSLFPTPPAHNAIPGEVFDRTKEGAFDKAKELLDGLTDTLRSVYDRAKDVKDIVVNTVSGFWDRTGGQLTSHFRDTGGFIPTGQSIVRNETGRPEAVLNWQQLDRVKWLMADAAAFASQFAQLAPIAEALSNAAMGVTKWQDQSAQERWSPYQQQVLRLVKDIRQTATDHGFGPEADAIAGPIVDSIENLDWDFVDARMSKTFAEMEKVGTDAGKAWVDDAAGVFGVSGLSGKIDAWDKFGKALNGEMQTSPNVPSAAQVTGSGYSLNSATAASKVEMPDLDTLESGGGDASGVKGVVKSAFAKYGWDKEPFWSATDWIVGKESSWNPAAKNPTSTASGLFQFLDSTWAETGVAKTSDPALQAAAGATYIKKRYGDPVKAKAFWEQNGWYDRGGVLSPGTTLAQNDSGKDELILTNEQWRNAARTAVEVNRMAELSTVGVSPGRVSGGDTININALDLPGAERMFRLREAQKAQRFVGVR